MYFSKIIDKINLNLLPLGFLAKLYLLYSNLISNDFFVSCRCLASADSVIWTLNYKSVLKT